MSRDFFFLLSRYLRSGQRQRGRIRAKQYREGNNLSQNLLMKHVIDILTDLSEICNFFKISFN
jgi:hypothetical protein